MSDDTYCQHDQKECRLRRLIRRHASHCSECDRLKGRWGCTRQSVLYSGEIAYGANRVMRAVFRKGWDARVAGRTYYDHDYDKNPKKHTHRGFGPAMAGAFEMGWAWADHYAALGYQLDDAKTMLTLAALGGLRPECLAPTETPEAWRSSTESPRWAARARRDRQEAANSEG